jgi:glycosyltransferase involved in cell wall biosynthesis
MTDTGSNICTGHSKGLILNDIKYVIITPARDEEKHIEGTIQSVIGQSIVPAEWVIVDDGSQDRTYEIIERYSTQYSWIHPFKRPDRGYRKSGGGVVDTFYDGYDNLETMGADFIVKLDGDLFFGNTYFEDCLKEFLKNPKLGIGGGTIYSNVGGKYVMEKNPSFHVRGATKIYRRDCWRDIGELIRAPGWDTLDEIKANMHGWETRSFPDILLYQERGTGGADGQWRDNVKNGLANYISGYHPVFMLLKCLKRIFRKPRIVGGTALMYGYIGGYITNAKQVDDKNLLKYVKQQQINRLLLRHSLWKY